MRVDAGENIGSNVARLVILANQLQKLAAGADEPDRIQQAAVQMQFELDQIRGWVLREENKALA